MATEAGAAPPPADTGPRALARRRRHGLWMFITGGTVTHKLLRDRLLTLALATLVLDGICSWLIWLTERTASGSQIRDYGDALFWTTTQLLSVSSNLTAPVTAAGRWVDVLMEIWAISVVATLAGSFGSFFHRQAIEHHPLFPWLQAKETELRAAAEQGTGERGGA